MPVNYIEFFFKSQSGGYWYVLHWQRMDWYSDYKRISKQEVELPKQSGSWQWFHLNARQRCVTSCQSNWRFYSRQHARFHQLTRMDIAFARSESTRLLYLGHITRTCLRRKAWTVRKPQRSWHCYQRQMAWCRRLDSEKTYFVVEKAFSSSGKAEWRTYSTHFLLVNWLMITVMWRFGLACVRARTWMMNRVQSRDVSIL